MEAGYLALWPWGSQGGCPRQMEKEPAGCRGRGGMAGVDTMCGGRMNVAWVALAGVAPLCSPHPPVIFSPREEEGELKMSNGRCFNFGYGDLEPDLIST